MFNTVSINDRRHLRRSISAYNDINNQQDATGFSFIKLFKFSNTCFGRQIRPSSGALFWLYIQLLVQCTDTAADRCHVALVGSSVGALYQKLYIQSKKRSWRWENLSPETCRAEFKKFNKRKTCCILLVVYIIVLVMKGHTNIEFISACFFIKTKAAR